MEIKNILKLLEAFEVYFVTILRLLIWNNVPAVRAISVHCLMKGFGRVNKEKLFPLNGEPVTRRHRV